MDVTSGTGTTGSIKCSSRRSGGETSDRPRFKRAVGRVLIALSFKSNSRRIARSLAAARRQEAARRDGGGADEREGGIDVEEDERASYVGGVEAMFGTSSVSLSSVSDLDPLFTPKSNAEARLRGGWMPSKSGHCGSVPSEVDHEHERGTPPCCRPRRERRKAIFDSEVGWSWSTAAGDATDAFLQDLNNPLTVLKNRFGDNGDGVSIRATKRSSVLSLSTINGVGKVMKSDVEDILCLPAVPSRSNDFVKASHSNFPIASCICQKQSSTTTAEFHCIETKYFASSYWTKEFCLNDEETKTPFTFASDIIRAGDAFLEDLNNRFTALKNRFGDNGDRVSIGATERKVDWSLSTAADDAFLEDLNNRLTALKNRFGDNGDRVSIGATERSSALSLSTINAASDKSDGPVFKPSSLPVLSIKRRGLCLVDDEDDGEFPDEDETSVQPTTTAPSESGGCEEDVRVTLQAAQQSVNYPGDLLSQTPRHSRSRALPPPLIKRNTIADFANTKAYQASTASLISASDQEKKLKSAFSLLKLIDKKVNRSRESLIPLGEILRSLKTSEFTDDQLSLYKDGHWLKILTGSDEDVCLNIPDAERKRRDAVWEMFTSECVFLFDHLMVLKHCFMEPLKGVQVEGLLMFAEPQDLFGNLDELCYVSYTFCYDFITLLLKESNVIDFGRTEVLVEGLRHFCELTRDGEVYHDYCLNYPKAISYLEQLRKNEDFCEFEKWCEQDPRCHRLQLTDLLIAPMQHCTKVPLLLNSIRLYTDDLTERRLLMESLETLEVSLKNLELKMVSLKNFERVQELRQQIVWQSITELEPRAFIPEFLRPTLSKQTCSKILSNPKRQLLYEGPATLLEISKAIDMYLFLFDDILILTKVKKPPRKKTSVTSADCSSYSLSHGPAACTDGAIFVVYRQPLALDRFTVHDVKPADAAANGLKNAFVLLHVSRFQQILGVFTLQMATEALKATWLSQLTTGQEKYREHLKWLASQPQQDPTSSTSRDSVSGRSPTNISAMTSFFDSTHTSSGLLHTPSFRRGLTPPKRRCSANRTTGEAGERSQSDVGLGSSAASTMLLVTKSAQQQQLLTVTSSLSPPATLMSQGCDFGHSGGVHIDSLKGSLSDSLITTTTTTPKDDQEHTTASLTPTGLGGDDFNGRSGIQISAGAAAIIDNRFLSPPSPLRMNGGSQSGMVYLTVDNVGMDQGNSLSDSIGCLTSAGSAAVCRQRPSSVHAKRRSLLKAIREKSVSIDMPAGSIVISSSSLSKQQ